MGMAEADMLFGMLHRCADIQYDSLIGIYMGKRLGANSGKRCHGIILEELRLLAFIL
jgi:hypothetical protein